MRSGRTHGCSDISSRQLINLSPPTISAAKPDLICRCETPPNPKSRTQNQTPETPLPMQANRYLPQTPESPLRVTQCAPYLHPIALANFSVPTVANSVQRAPLFATFPR